MKLLIDANHHFIRTLFNGAVIENGVPSYDLFKYLIFDHLLSFQRRFSPTQIILAFDGPNYWRKIVYPNYKHGRKRARDESPIDWDEFFKQMHAYKKELKEHLPFVVLQVDRCEADDIITVLVQDFKKGIIISSDSDYRQLLNNDIKQYDPFKRKFLEPKHNVDVLCLAGLAKDGIPNILTPLDWDWDSKARRPRMGEAKAQKILDSGLDKWLQENDLEARFTIQKRLIDYNYIPNVLKTRILSSYYTYEKVPPENIIKFLQQYNWKYYKDRLLETETKLMEIY